MNRKALGVLAVAIVLAMFVVVLVGDSGLSGQTERRAQTELDELEQSKRSFTALVGRIESALEAEPAFFKAGAFDTQWASAVELGNARIEAADTAAAEVRALLEQDDKKLEQDTLREIEKVNAARVGAVAAVEPAASEADRLLAFKTELPARLEAMEADYAVVRAYDLGPVTDRVRQARADWPDKREDLGARLERLTEISELAERGWKETEDLRQAAASGEIGPESLVELARKADALRRAKASLIEGPPKLAALVDELYWSWDKILSDMEINEGYEVGFRHQYRTVYTPVQQTERSGMLDGAGLMTITLAGLLQDAPPPDASGEPEITDPSAAGVRVEETWETVGKAEFEKMKNNLGMVVAHKPAGRYDHEAETMTQPAGYQYVAPYGERNRYGYWDGGFWRFYGQYAFMRDMFWGRGYRMGRNDWDDYSRHRASGRTYYGDRYGSNGTATKSKYSSSKYVRTGGYKDSQYVKSGGTYRGSRYASRSTGGSRSGGFSRSGGRSGGK